VMASTLALAADEQRKRGTVRRCPNLCLRTDATASDDDADDRDLRFRPNSAVQLRRTAPAARRSHSWRAIVPTRPDPAMPMATTRWPASEPAAGAADDRIRRSTARQLISSSSVCVPTLPIARLSVRQPGHAGR
jgi:hypothetical protein